MEFLVNQYILMKYVEILFCFNNSKSVYHNHERYDTTPIFKLPHPVYIFQFKHFYGQPFLKQDSPCRTAIITGICSWNPLRAIHLGKRSVRLFTDLIGSQFSRSVVTSGLNLFSPLGIDPIILGIDTFIYY